MGTWKQCCASRSASGYAARPSDSPLGRSPHRLCKVVVLSLTGSLLVYRNELDRYLATPHATFDEKARAMNGDELRSAALKAYPGWQVTDVAEGRTVRRPPRAGGPAAAPEGAAAAIASRIRPRRSRPSGTARRRSVCSIRTTVRISATTRRAGSSSSCGRTSARRAS